MSARWGLADARTDPTDSVFCTKTPSNQSRPAYTPRLSRQRFRLLRTAIHLALLPAIPQSREKPGFVLVGMQKLQEAPSIPPPEVLCERSQAQ